MHVHRVRAVQDADRGRRPRHRVRCCHGGGARRGRDDRRHRDRRGARAGGHRGPPRPGSFHLTAPDQRGRAHAASATVRHRHRLQARDPAGARLGADPLPDQRDRLRAGGTAGPAGGAGRRRGGLRARPGFRPARQPGHARRGRAPSAARRRPGRVNGRRGSVPGRGDQRARRDGSRLRSGKW